MAVGVQEDKQCQPLGGSAETRRGAASTESFCPRTGTFGIRAVFHRVFSFPVFLAVLLAAGAFACTAWENAAIPAGKLFSEGDTWWHLAVGERILATGNWPTTDPYSFTVHGNSWIAYEWLGEVLMAVAARLGGLQGMAVLLVLLSVTLVLLLYYYAWLRSGNAKAAAAAVALLLPVSGVAFTLRPQLLGYICLLVTLICLERFRLGNPGALWLLPGVFLVWVNTHGSFLLGFITLGLYWACGQTSFHCGTLFSERWTPTQSRRLQLIVMLCLLAVTVTPYGTRLAAYPAEFMTRQPHITQVITEWQPLDLSLAAAKVFLALVLAFLIAQVVFPITHRLESLCLLLFTIGETFLHARFMVFFALVFAPVLAMLFANLLPNYEPQEDHHVVNAVLIATMVWGMVAFFPSRGKLQRNLAQAFPAGAVDYLRQHPVEAGMFNEDTWGGFLIWSLGPQHRVFIDGRADIYEYGGVLQHYIRITGLDRSALPLLQAYGVKACLLHRGIPLETLLAALPDWKRVYGDELSVIFVRAGQSGDSLTQNRRSDRDAEKPRAAASLSGLYRQQCEQNQRRRTSAQFLEPL